MSVSLGQSFGGGGEAIATQATFTTTAIAGAPVYVDGADSVDLARANATATSAVLGLARAAVTATNSGDVITDGVVTLTTAEWDALAGTTGGLTPQARLYLNVGTAGRLTETIPTAPGEYVVEVGKALSPTKLHVRVRRRILHS